MPTSNWSCLQVIYSLLIPAFFIGGCVRTVIPSAPLESGFSRNLDRLRAANGRPLGLAVSLNEEALSAGDEAAPVGHQYLFFLVPFGRVYFEDLQSDVLLKAKEQLVLGGHSPVLARASLPERYLTLLISIQDVSLTAYDLFFVRRLKCGLKVTGELVRSGGEVRRSWTATAEQSEFRRYGFAKELKGIFGKCLDEGLSEIIRELRL